MAFNRNTPEYRRWRRNIILRDGGRCTKCGSELYLEVHHIKPVADYPELALDEDNGVTLCRRCHYQTDGRYFDEYNQYKNQIELIGPFKDIRAISYKIRFHLETIRNLVIIGPIIVWVCKKLWKCMGLFIILGILYCYQHLLLLFN